MAPRLIRTHAYCHTDRDSSQSLPNLLPLECGCCAPTTKWRSFQLVLHQLARGRHLSVGRAQWRLYCVLNYNFSQQIHWKIRWLPEHVLCDNQRTPANCNMSVSIWLWGITFKKPFPGRAWNDKKDNINDTLHYYGYITLMLHYMHITLMLHYFNYTLFIHYSWYIILQDHYIMGNIYSHNMI